jgi:hypothetical protein
LRTFLPRVCPLRQVGNARLDHLAELA